MKKLSLASIMLIVVVVCVGCSSLSDKQMLEVRSFSKNSEGYVDGPGKVYRIYGDAALECGIVRSAIYTDGNLAKDEVEKSLKARNDIYASAAKMDLALDVLQSYSRLIGALASEKFDKITASEVVSASAELDGMIGSFRGETINCTFGDCAALAVQTVGWMYIKKRQTNTLKLVIAKADPLIEDVTLKIKTLLDLYEEQKIIDSLENDLRSNYAILVKRGGSSWNVDGTGQYASIMGKIGKVRLVCDSCRDATENYRLAHHKLAECIAEDKKLEASIDEFRKLCIVIKRMKELIDRDTIVFKK